MSTESRIEHDAIGEIQVPLHALHGAQTERALRNFQLSGTTISKIRFLLPAFAQVKCAAAMVNKRTGAISSEIADAIIAATDQIVAGRCDHAFEVDALQGGAGTSTNMNMNEVLANLAAIQVGTSPGRYDVVHPNDHVNRNQSTNDAYPTAMRIALFRSTGELLERLGCLCDAFEGKGSAHSSLAKIGRTQLQDAVQITFGEEMVAYAHAIRMAASRLDGARRPLLAVHMGGTAIGTGLGAETSFQSQIVGVLADVTGLALVPAADRIQSTWDASDFVALSGALKMLAALLSKISNDLRLLASGPNAGFGELHLVPRQPGSSLMPGKVNPVMLEAVNQCAFRVLGADLTVTLAAEAGQLQLNAFLPVILFSLSEMSALIGAATDCLTETVSTCAPNSGQITANLDRTTARVTELVSSLGYARATNVAKLMIEKRISLADAIATAG